MKRPPLSLLVVAAGLAVLALGGAVLLWPWFEAARWQAAPEAARAQRNAEAPTPIWIRPTTPPARLAVSTASVSLAPTPLPRGAPAPLPIATSTPVTVAIDVAPALTPTPAASDLELTGASFAFVDPPEPGAAARLTISVRNPTELTESSVSVRLPLSWLSGYRIDSIDPALIDAAQGDVDIRLSFEGPTPGRAIDLSLGLVAIDEVIDAPVLTVSDGEGRLVGRAHPSTEAPPARPGPIYSIDVPRLKLHTGVVPVEWEPPLFVVGQVKSSAFVTLGNSVLVGHVRGAPGYSVFDRLDQLEPGDQVIANSRGQPYSFLVKQTEVLPQDDTSPTLPSAAPRLTLMTCAGDWNPLTRDYPDRLWVIAEPDPEAMPQLVQEPQPLRGPR